MPIIEKEYYNYNNIEYDNYHIVLKYLLIFLLLYIIENRFELFATHLTILYETKPSRRMILIISPLAKS